MNSGGLGRGVVSLAEMWAARPRCYKVSAKVYSGRPRCAWKIDQAPVGIAMYQNVICPRGVLLVVNHGVSISLLEEFKREVVYFFKLSLEDKKKLWQQPDNHEGFGQLFVVSEEQKLDWSDMFYITTLPTSLRRTQLFDLLPPKLRETMEAYSAEVKKLAMIILSQMAKALKMDNEEMKELFSDGVQSMRMNYYPPCPEPDMAIGITPHSDAGALTILYQLNDTQGLQIQKEGKWVPVKPLQDAFVVNIGDIMEIVSNGVYQSIEHRAMVNSRKERMSIATFYSTNLESELGPARSLIGPNKPAVFRRVLFDKYFKDFFARKLKVSSNNEIKATRVPQRDPSSQPLELDTGLFGTLFFAALQTLQQMLAMIIYHAVQSVDFKRDDERERFYRPDPELIPLKQEVIHERRGRLSLSEIDVRRGGDDTSDVDPGPLISEVGVSKEEVDRRGSVVMDAAEFSNVLRNVIISVKNSDVTQDIIVDDKGNVNTNTVVCFALPYKHAAEICISGQPVSDEGCRPPVMAGRSPKVVCRPPAAMESGLPATDA
ncbi:hypothetical protein TEA_011835 [Camellia sinensis var. sinensis]|uniref:Fe2OG dioxygenase domain-containing protein n=1 Tax=Camellia sinensis var. sinensis TaxID=542762 RepID=A0A4V3WNE7_CAMSN|nr:hypothetical protein TEA_011835 [Camellia sinensis var. sinensis]